MLTPTKYGKSGDRQRIPALQNSVSVPGFPVFAILCLLWLIPLVRAASPVPETAEDRRGSLTEAGLDLQLDVAASPLWVNGDATRLAQVVGNLLQNALKFTDRGGRVTVCVAPAADGRHALVA